jgi:integrator complex subunit 11
MEMLDHLNPNNVVLVHGEKEGMITLAEKIKSVMKIPCFYPPNHSICIIETPVRIPFSISTGLLNQYLGKVKPKYPFFNIPSILMIKS